MFRQFCQDFPPRKTPRKSRLLLGLLDRHSCDAQCSAIRIRSSPAGVQSCLWSTSPPLQSCVTLDGGSGGAGDASRPEVSHLATQSGNFFGRPSQKWLSPTADDEEVRRLLNKIMSSILSARRSGTCLRRWDYIRLDLARWGQTFNDEWPP